MADVPTIALPGLTSDQATQLRLVVHRIHVVVDEVQTTLQWLDGVLETLDPQGSVAQSPEAQPSKPSLFSRIVSPVTRIVVPLAGWLLRRRLGL